MPAPKTPRASYILVDTQGAVQMYAIYPARVSLSSLRPVVSALNAFANVRADVRTGSVDHVPDPNAVVITLRLVNDRNLTAILKLFKSLTRPVLPIGVAELAVNVLVCTCGFVSTRVRDIRFVVGFGPADDEAFMLRMFAQIREMPIPRLLEQSMDDPGLGLLMQALEQMLATLGAHVTALRVKPMPDPNPCTHPADDAGTSETAQ